MAADTFVYVTTEILAELLGLKEHHIRIRECWSAADIVTLELTGEHLPTGACEVIYARAEDGRIFLKSITKPDPSSLKFQEDLTAIDPPAPHPVR